MPSHGYETQPASPSPPTPPPGEEAVLGARLDVWVSASDKYMAGNCLPGGAPKTHNMDTAGRVGLSKLKKRVQAGDIVVIPADKGSQFTVSSQESFARQGDSHTSKDRRIDSNQLNQVQARMNALSRGLAKGGQEHSTLLEQPHLGRLCHASPVSQPQSPQAGGQCW